MGKFNCLNSPSSQSGLTFPAARRGNGYLLFSILRTGILAGLFVCFAAESRAASGKWISTSSSDWSVGANWDVGYPLGSTTSLSSDTVTFKGAAYQLSVLPDAGRSVGYILFDQIALNNAGSYTIGVTNGNALFLGKTDGTGSVTINATVTTPNTTETVNAPLICSNSYQFVNSSSESSVTLVIGDVTSGAASGNVDIQLKGNNTGANKARGVISDGTSTVSLNKLNAGTWYVTGTNSTYTKNTTVNQGTLIAAANVPASGPGPFGNSSAAVLVGNSTSAAAGDATLLVGDGAVGYTLARPVTVQLLTAPSTQTAGLGGANTAGVSYVTGNLSLNRNLILQSATGGKVVFQSGTWTARDKVLTIGRSGYLGTVKIANSLSTTGGVNVAYGTLEAAGALTSAVSVSASATLSGTGTVSGAVALVGNATCAPGSDGVGTLTINGNATFQSGSRFSAKVSEAGTVNKLTASGTISLDNVLLDVTAPNSFAGTVVIARADTAITGTFSASSSLPPFCSVVYTAKEAKLRFTTGTLISIR